MHRIKTLSKISPAGLSILDQTRYAISTDMENEGGILVRSAGMHGYAPPGALRAVARTGTGTNNIPIDHCSEAGIVVFSVSGVNANAAKELAMCALLLTSQKISNGAVWVKEQATARADVEQAVERGKSQFVDPGLSGKVLNVIGLEATGVQVANIATELGITVSGYDPSLSMDGTLFLSQLVYRTINLETICRSCDYITPYIPQTPEAKGMFNEDALHMMKGGVRILNPAWGILVNDDDMLAALDSGEMACYVTDFPSGRVLRGKNVVTTPHLGTFMPESEESCAVMTARKPKDYLGGGSIQNSVSLPTLVQPQSGVSRLCIIHHNAPDVTVNITGVLSKDEVNVASMTNKSKEDCAYTVVDVDSRIGESVVDTIRALDMVLQARLFSH